MRHHPRAVAGRLNGGRAHAHDVYGLRAVIESPAAYIGMIGSQRRVWAVFKLLHDEGVPAEKLARVRAPIGLDLGGSTPEEIALSIMSEIILLRRNGSGVAMSEALRGRYMERLRRLDEGEARVFCGDLADSGGTGDAGEVDAQCIVGCAAGGNNGAWLDADAAERERAIDELHRPGDARNGDGGFGAEIGAKGEGIE